MRDMGGPAKTPTVINKARGNPGHRPMNEHEPTVPDVGQPEPPADLDDCELKIWNQLAGTLYIMGVLTVADIDEFAMYCRAMVRFMDASEQLKEEEFVIKAGNGARTTNPLIRVIEQAANEMHRIRQNFGMTPAARTKIAATPPSEGKGNKFDGQQRAG